MLYSLGKQADNENQNELFGLSFDKQGMCFAIGT